MNYLFEYILIFIFNSVFKYKNSINYTIIQFKTKNNNNLEVNHKLIYFGVNFVFN
jgi:hypothetical protein